VSRLVGVVEARRKAAKEDTGQALVLAVIVIVMLALLIPIVGSSIIAENLAVNRNAISEQALAAAQAGVQDYRNFIDNVPQYYAYDCGSNNGNLALGAGSPTYACNSWAPVPGAVNEWYHYLADSSQLQLNAGGSPSELLLEVTGRAGTPGNYAYRTLLVGFQLEGILTDSYYSEYELTDPNEPNVYNAVQVTSGGVSSDEAMNSVSVEYAYLNQQGTYQYFGPESLLNALCVYHTYNENTFIDSLGNVTNKWVGAGNSVASASNPYYGPFYDNPGGGLTINIPNTLPNGVVPPNAGAKIQIPAPGYSGAICGQYGQGVYTSGVTFNGIAYTNDQLALCGNPQFNGSPPLISGAPQNYYYGDDWPGSQSSVVAGKTVYSPKGYTYDFTGGGCGAGSSPSYGAAAAPKAPTLGGQQHLPTTTSFLKQYADGTQANGCLYTGPTMIEFVAGGTMNVWSPLSQSTEPNFTSGTAADCGTFTPSQPWQTGLTVPPDGVIYVQGEQSTGFNSGWAGGAPPINTAPCSGNATPPTVNQVGIYTCGLSGGKYVQVGQPLQAAVAAVGSSPAIPVASCINPYFYNYWSPTPSPGAPPGLVTTSPSSGSCEEGDAIVEGEFHGQVTIATDSNIIVDRNLTYQCADTAGVSDADPGNVAACNSAGANDVLGLLPNNQLIVNHPLNEPFNTSCSTSGGNQCYTSNAPICADDGTEATQTIANIVPWSCDVKTNFSDGPGIAIDAAVVSLNGSTYEPNFNVGTCLGNLSQQGTNINYYPGFNGTGNCSTGYNQVITYDQRLSYLNPPFLLAATDSVWDITSFIVCGTLNSANFPVINAGGSTAYQKINCPALP